MISCIIIGAIETDPVRAKVQPKSPHGRAIGPNQILKGK